MLNQAWIERSARMPEPIRFGLCWALPEFSRLLSITGVNGAPRLNVSMLFSRHPPINAWTGPRASPANFLPRPKGNEYIQLNARLWRISKSELPRYNRKLDGFWIPVPFEFPLELSMLWANV